jgi:hypothetical protein
MNDFVLGSSTIGTAQEIGSLADRARTGTLMARKTDHQTDGDTRYWGVDVSQSQVLSALKAFAEAQFAAAAGTPPAMSFIMVNHIDARRSPNGSGGGWHRDAFNAQYKAFAYLTDTTRQSLGAFCFLPASNTIPFRLASLASRLLSGANRYSDRAIETVLKAGFSKRVVLLDAGIPFFVNTSLIHRGLPIVEAERVMATVYMFATFSQQFADYQ